MDLVHIWRKYTKQQLIIQLQIPVKCAYATLSLLHRRHTVRLMIDKKQTHGTSRRFDR